MNNLSEVLSKWRWSEKMTSREAALWIGLTKSTYFRMEQGKPTDGKTMATVIKWLLSERKQAPK